MKQRTIFLRIDPVQTRSRVAQFFDSTTGSIANELLQNARRAGAAKVDITVDDTTVTVSDDGCGIDDPAVLLNFGRSHWDARTLQRETPAGMGLASLARRVASIETRPPGAEPEDGWRVTLTPAHWRGEGTATVEPRTVAGGTSVTF
ncbi:MAG: ATP-binding protein, partial [Acidobacteria bacterium]|nr:ATP-binding protein [Acidobacteriota bacterium]